MVIVKTVISTIDVILGMAAFCGTDGKNNKIIAAGASLLIVGLNLLAMWL